MSTADTAQSKHKRTWQEDQHGAGRLRGGVPSARVGALPAHVHEQRLYERQVHLVRVGRRLVARDRQRRLGRAAGGVPGLRVVLNGWPECLRPSTNPNCQ